MAAVHETEAQPLPRSPALPAPAAETHLGWSLLLGLIVAAQVAWVALICFILFRLVT